MLYHKINSIFNRETGKRKGKLIYGEWCKPEYEYLAKNNWILNEKLDGTNVFVSFDGEFVTILGRTENAEHPIGLMRNIQSVFTLDVLKNTFPKASKDSTVVLYGEGIGKEINGNRHGLDGYEFVLFDVLVSGKWWLSQENITDVASKIGVRSSPVVGLMNLYDAIDLVKKGFRSHFGGFSEGVIAKPAVPMLSRDGKRIITKIKHIDFNGV